MNLPKTSFSRLFNGGPGSGCHGPNCGRPRNPVVIYRGVRSASGDWRTIGPDGRLGAGTYWTTDRQQALNYAGGREDRVMTATVPPDALFDASDEPATPEFVADLEKRLPLISQESRDLWFSWKNHQGNTLAEKLENYRPGPKTKLEVLFFMADIDGTGGQDGSDRLKEMGFIGVRANAKWGGGSTSDGYEFLNIFNPSDVQVEQEPFPAMPKLRPQLRTGTLGQEMERQKERALAMEQVYGVKFSRQPSNPVGTKEARAEGRPAAGLPLAIFDNTVPERPDLVPSVTKVWDKWKDPVTGYVPFSTVALGEKIPFQDVMGAVKALLKPQQATLTVNRMGDAVYFKLRTGTKETS